MTMEEIIQKHSELEKELRFSLSTMERKSKIFEIRKQLVELQKDCPHYSSEYNFTIVDGHCPYCGKRLEENKTY